MSTVIELIESVKHRLESRDNIYPALNKAIRLANKRLMFHDSDLCTGALSVSVLASAATATMPSDFWGLRGLPYISGQTYPLRPVPSKQTTLDFQTAAQPLYYEIIGQTMRLIPATSSAITILGDYWQRPTKITGPRDTIPYFEQLDDIIGEFLVESMKTKPVQESELQQLIVKSIDEFIFLRDKKGNIPFPDGTDWDGLANG